MINRLLVANRGEIVRRVFRTCRDLGIETVAIHSDADAHLPFVAEADHAVRLPGNTPAETYLRTDLVLAAARSTGADAIHPGYGFLSENADFARAVIEAGIAWLGPSPESIEQMGSKIESKKLMEAAGVPVLGNLAVDSATEDDLPLLVKASAGGGGRGMRVVRDLADLAGEVERASAEAASAFGDGTVFVEPYVERGRHVEVQVVGDGAGEVAVFGTRDCSLQRRHQKVVEEAPAPAIPDAVRERIHEAAHAAAASVDYQGAGTVEFLYDAARESFWFLEMNTRLQVEHPVTEAVFGVDLVALQIAVAEGRSGADLAAPAPAPNGHAIEARLYAEDPTADYAPQTGRLLELAVEHDAAFHSPGFGVRLDTGFETGDEVGTFYDAMLAKVIVHAPSRQQAARLLARVLEKARIHGLVTNRDQLVASLRHPAFADATGLTTAFYDDHPETLDAPGGDDLIPFVGAVALAQHRQARARVQSRIPAGFRNVVAAPSVTRFARGGDEIEVRWFGPSTRGPGFTLAEPDPERPVTVVTASPEEVVLDVAGVARRYRTRVQGSTGPDALLVDGPSGGATLRVVPRFVDPADQVAEGSLLAPMPGSVVVVHGAVGDEVAAGQPIVVMEAMKMQHTITAPYAGTLTDLPAQAGQQVEAGAVLAVVEPADSPENPAEGADA
ncbi:biotin carboxylase N-terminal domain-containing protein [Nocardioides sp. AE5]|nr:biotin carboxylase N-terminal domain-containing protein [Nocardioides sp. AE5]